MNKPLLALSLLATGCTAAKTEKPNVVLIMVDDMGYSDIGCYGGEITTPNIDALASQGVRLTQFYNASRSCPTRASLLTGLYQHQTGIGQMSEDASKQPKGHNDWGTEGYRGYLNRNCMTIAEVLKESGYNTYMTGKWHVGMDKQERWPLQRGFDHFYGILAGACSYLQPSGERGITFENEKQPDVTADDYYTTDVFTDYALKFIEEQENDSPFFLYLAYNAPHWPLHAKEADIEKFKDIYREKGWDEIRQARHAKMEQIGIIDEDTPYAEWENRAWDELSEQEKDEVALRMAVYAAQIHCVDYNVGRLIDHLKATGEYDNTLFFFLSDNGACAEMYHELGSGETKNINNPKSAGMPSIGRAWAQTANTPFRKYKTRAYEGGISTPLIVSWQSGFGNNGGELRETPGFIADIMATIIDATGSTYPETYHDGNVLRPLAGKSLIPVIKDECDDLHEYIFFEHQNNQAVRWGDWKAVCDQDIKEWELYNITADRCETTDLAEQEPEILAQLTAKWEEWADECYVLPKRAPKK